MWDIQTQLYMNPCDCSQTLVLKNIASMGLSNSVWLCIFIMLQIRDARTEVSSKLRVILHYVYDLGVATFNFLFSSRLSFTLILVFLC